MSARNALASRRARARALAAALGIPVHPSPAAVDAWIRAVVRRADLASCAPGYASAAVERHEAIRQGARLPGSILAAERHKARGLDRAVARCLERAHGDDALAAAGLREVGT